MTKISRNKLRLQRKKRISAKIKAQIKNPRLAVFKSLKEVYAQIIDDSKGVTLFSVTAKEAKAKNNLEGAKKVGKLIAKKCLDKKIEAVVFDRAGYKYHGKIKALADGAREAGLKL
ncbi:MAG: 50S ribosomal protein L18 [Patescibacteria group bacterium]